MADVTVTLGDGIDNDATITIPAPGAGTRENAWLTINTGEGNPVYSLNVIHSDEGIVLDLYYAGHEDDDGMAATTYAFHADSPDNTEEGDTK